MIVYAEHPKESTHKPLENNEFSKGSGCEVNI